MGESIWAPVGTRYEASKSVAESTTERDWVATRVILVALLKGMFTEVHGSATNSRHS